MSLLTLIALIFTFRSSSGRDYDPEKGPSETSNENSRNLRAQGEILDQDRDGDVDVDVDDNGEIAAEPDPDLHPQTINAPKPHSGDSSDRPSLLTRIKSFMFPPSADDLYFTPNYRYAPLISGIVIPFSILLEIPGLTAHWYTHTQDNVVIEISPNPALLDIGLAFSMACAVIANICIVIRFLERRVMEMTLLCIVFLSIHDLINIVTVTVFGVSHRLNDGFTYGASFWMTVCSTIVSAITNVTLIIDLIRTPDFKTSGSGLTPKQRSLMILLIILFIYIALGSLVNSFLLSLTFINGLYFTITSIETIGFGDIVPISSGSRVFLCFYAVFGIVNLAVVVGMVQDTVREGLEIGYLRRLQQIRERRRAARRRKHAERRWRSAVIWRLREKGTQVWVRKCRSQPHNSLWAVVKRRFFKATEKIPHHINNTRGMRLNLEALTHAQLEAAAVEAGVPLDTLLPPCFYDAQLQDDANTDVEIASPFPAWSISHPVYGMNVQRGAHQSLTDQRLGAMVALLTRFAIGFGVLTPQAAVDGVDGFSGDAALENAGDLSVNAAGVGGHSIDSSTTFAATSSRDDFAGPDYNTMIVDTEKQALCVRSSLAWTLFVVFWMVGSAIFSQTEGWSYGSSIYFCFVAFTTIGYGDLAPKTPAGRSVFVVWALLGVAAMTVLISVASEAYSKRYKGMLHSNYFDRVVRLYRSRTKEMYRTRTWTQSLPEAQDVIQNQSVVLASPTVHFQPSLPLSSGLRRRATLLSEQDSEGGEGSQQFPEREQEMEINAAGSDMPVEHLLEIFPQHVLSEVRSFQEYMRYLGNCGTGNSVQSGSSINAHVDERLRALLEDVVGTDGMKESVKRNILKDKDTRRTLVTLSIEKSLMELVSIAEEAIAAINERHRITAAWQMDREDVDAEVGG